MAGAGYTVVTAQVMDRNGQLYVNANFSVSFVNLNTVPGAAMPTLGNSEFQTEIFGNQCDSSGNFSIVLADNNLVTPLPSQWRFSICSRFYTGPKTRYCFEWQGTITGPTMDITALLQAVAALLPVVGAGGGPIPINSLLAATGPNDISNNNFTQAWRWLLTGTAPEDGLFIAEPNGLASTNTGSLSALVGIGTHLGSTVAPFRAIAQSGPGLMVNAGGDVQAVAGATFIGPVRLPLISQTVLGTDTAGNIIPSAAAGGGGPTPINQLLNASGPNDITSGDFQQTWRWLLTGTTPMDGLLIDEPNGLASSNTGTNSALLGVGTHVGSTIAPFRAIAQSGPGLMVNSVGDIVAVVGATFTGPLRIPTLPSVPVLGTDPTGLIIPGTSTGVGIATIAVPVTFTAAGTQIVTHNLGTANPLYSVLSFGGAPPSAVTVAPNGAASVLVTSSAAASLVISFAFVATVAPPAAALASLTLSPSTVVGGVVNPTGTVTLTSPAPGSDAYITLTSSNPAVALTPVAVVILGGSSVGTFPVSTFSVASPTSVTISASYGGTTQSANLTVNPPAPPAQPIYGGVGTPGATASITVGPGSSVTLSTGDVLPQIKASAEVAGGPGVGDTFSFSPVNQSIYLLLVGGIHTFVDQNGAPFPFNTPITAIVSGRTMFLYQSQFAQSSPFTIRVAS